MAADFQISKQIMVIPIPNRALTDDVPPLFLISRLVSNLILHQQHFLLFLHHLSWFLWSVTNRFEEKKGGKLTKWTGKSSFKSVLQKLGHKTFDFSVPESGISASRPVSNVP